MFYNRLYIIPELSNKITEGYNIILHYNKGKDKASALKADLQKISNKTIITVQANAMEKESIDNMFTEIKRHFDTISAFVNTSMLQFGNIKFKSMEWQDISKQIDINIIENFIQRLELSLTHIHPNNYGKLDENNDPIIIELSFEKYPKIIDGEVELPNILDQKNNPKKNDIFIKFNEN